MDPRYIFFGTPFQFFLTPTQKNIFLDILKKILAPNFFMTPTIKKKKYFFALPKKGKKLDPLQKYFLDVSKRVNKWKHQKNILILST